MKKGKNDVFNACKICLLGNTTVGYNPTNALLQAIHLREINGNTTKESESETSLDQVKKTKKRRDNFNFMTRAYGKSLPKRLSDAEPDVMPKEIIYL